MVSTCYEEKLFWGKERCMKINIEGKMGEDDKKKGGRWNKSDINEIL